MVRPRRNDPNSAVSGRLRPDPNVPRREQKVQRALLSQPRPYRRREPTLLQAAGVYLLLGILISRRS